MAFLKGDYTIEKKSDGNGGWLKTASGAVIGSEALKSALRNANPDITDAEIDSLIDSYLEGSNTLFAVGTDARVYGAFLVDGGIKTDSITSNKSGTIHLVNNTVADGDLEVKGRLIANIDADNITGLTEKITEIAGQSAPSGSAPEIKADVIKPYTDSNNVIILDGDLEVTGTIRGNFDLDYAEIASHIPGGGSGTVNPSNWIYQTVIHVAEHPELIGRYSIAVNHNLGTQTVNVTIYRYDPVTEEWDNLLAYIDCVSANTLYIRFCEPNDGEARLIEEVNGDNDDEAIKPGEIYRILCIGCQEG